MVEGARLDSDSGDAAISGHPRHLMNCNVSRCCTSVTTRGKPEDVAGAGGGAALLRRRSGNDEQARDERRSMRVQKSNSVRAARPL